MAICIEEAIQEAQRDGRFSNLPGQGRPLHLDPSPDAVVNNLVKNAHIRPEWIEVGCQIDALQTAIKQHLVQFSRRHPEMWRDLAPNPASKPDFSVWKRWWHLLWHGSGNRLRGGDPVAKFNRYCGVSLARYAALLHQTNALIRRFNRLVPHRELQRNILPVHELLTEFAAEFPQAAPTQTENSVSVASLRIPVPEYLLHEPNASEKMPRVTRQQQILEHGNK